MLAIGKDWRACVSICFATALNVQCGRRSVSRSETCGASGVLECSKRSGSPSRSEGGAELRGREVRTGGAGRARARSEGVGGRELGNIIAKKGRLEGEGWRLRLEGLGVSERGDFLFLLCTI